MLVAIVGDATPSRVYVPPMTDPVLAKKAAEELGAELAKKGVRLLVYGGPFLEADVVRGYVSAEPTKDHSIVMWYTKGHEPPPFPEEATHPKLFERRVEVGADWESAFYKSITRADGLVLLGGDKSVVTSGHVASGMRMPLMALASFGGGASRVWDTLSAGSDLPSREDLNLMQRPWRTGAAVDCVKSLFTQHSRRRLDSGAPSGTLILLGLLLFLAALAMVPLIWGHNKKEVWMLFLGPLLIGGGGAAVRLMVDRARGAPPRLSTAMSMVMGLVAGGIAGVLFVTAQLTADPTLADSTRVMDYARRSLPYGLGIGFVAGMTAEAVFGKLLGLDVVRTTGIIIDRPQS